MKWHILMEQGPDFCGLDLMDRNAEEKGIQMTMIPRRKISSETMSTYLLIIITFAANFFKNISFEAAIAVNLTNMLVMTTSVMEKLPPTSFPKMISFR